MCELAKALATVVCGEEKVMMGLVVLVVEVGADKVAWGGMRF